MGDCGLMVSVVTCKQSCHRNGICPFSPAAKGVLSKFGVRPSRAQHYLSIRTPSNISRFWLLEVAAPEDGRNPTKHFRRFLSRDRGLCLWRAWDASNLRHGFPGL